MKRSLRFWLALALAPWTAAAQPRVGAAQVRDIPPVQAVIGTAAGASGSATAPAAPAPTGLALPPVAAAPAAAGAPAPVSPSVAASKARNPAATGVAASIQGKDAPKAGPVARASAGSAAKPLAAAAGAKRGEGEAPSSPTLSQGRALFDGDAPRSAPAPVAAAATAAEHARRFERYVQGIFGDRVPTERERRALLENYLEDRGLAADSKPARELEERVFPGLEPVSPRYNDLAPALRKLAAAHGVPVARLEALIKQQGLEHVLVLPRETDLLIQALDRILTAEEVLASVAHYPDTAQGAALRNLAESVTARSGKSVEELARAGAFLYVDFNGKRVTETHSGRDPDVSTCDVVFYGVLEAGRWNIGVYRQNRRSGVSGSDSHYQAALRSWLIEGGISEEDLAF